MATIYRELGLNAPAEFVWQAIRDVGAVHTRFARGFVTDTQLVDDVRTVSFANGFTVHERIVAIDDEHMRLAYTSVGGRASHHNASFQVIALTQDTSRLSWITDLLPDEVSAAIEQMVDLGLTAIRQTLASDWKTAQR